MKFSVKKFLNIFAIVFILMSCKSLFPVTKRADEVFEKWTKIQNVFKEINIEKFGNNLDNTVFIFLKSRYASVLNFLQTLSVVFDLLPKEYIENGFLKTSIPSDDLLEKRFKYLCNLFQNDIPGFINYLRKNNFLNKRTNSFSVSGNLDEYRDILSLIFFCKNIFDMEQVLFSVANKFFEYCFYKKTWPMFEKLQLNEDEHSITKFLYSIMWFHLAGNGWKNWSARALKNLKKEAKNGKEIVYIAGGSDIYQLIKNGVYNIRIIDPLLPSQPKYYAQGWNFLIHPSSLAGVSYFNLDGSLLESDKVDEKDGIGDIIEFNVDSKKIVMKRESFKFIGDTLRSKLSIGKIAQIEKSETVWGIYDWNGKKLGKFTIERRFVGQDDFEYKDDRVILISFNELYFISTTINKGGWGINPYRFDKKLKIFVKQLHNPIKSCVSQNMRKAFEQLEFNYIALGTCID
ncbi:hypothetical protein KAT08_01690 [Candidatus Babeliales bacterium]|nr:hypothetical protein [Candidatus Babeliales bacterium]